MAGINTRLLILSDTHADDGQLRLSADVAIHCGDLTEESKLCEFVASIRLLKGIRAPLKLAIAGNHDFTLDTPLFRRKIAEAVPALDPDLVKKEFGEYGEARQLLAAAGIVLLGEGRHQFTLDNGALLTVYASPYTPSPHAEMGFQFKPKDGHNFEIGPGVDVAITHGPPRGVLDMTDSKERGGCEELFAEVARARPRLHCFGHIHEGWGAKSVAWRGREATASPSHFTDIDNGRSATLDTLASFKPGKWDTPELATEKKARLERYTAQGYCSARSGPLHPKEDAAAQTLFVNAAIQSLEEEGPSQLPWLVEMELPRAARSATTKKRASPCGDSPNDSERPAKRRRQSA